MSKVEKPSLWARVLAWLRGENKVPASEQVFLDRRRELRVPVELRVALRFETVEDVVHSRTVNISEGGMFIGTRSPRPEGTRVRISMDVGERQIELGGMVVHKVSPAEAGNEPPGMGVQFLNLDDDATALVHEIMARAQGRV